MAVWTTPNAKQVRHRLRHLREILPDEPEHVVEFADFFADHLRDSSHLTPKIWVMAYRRAVFLWLMDQKSSVRGHFDSITLAVHDAGFAEAASEEFTK